MLKTNNVFKQIINKRKDFKFINEILPNEKYMKLIYDKIFSEIFKFIKRKKGTEIESCTLKNNIGNIMFKHNKNVYLINMVFDKNFVDLSINNKKQLNLTIFGAQIDKDNLIAYNIKINISSFKEIIDSLF
jgi:hypothetical protein